MAEAHSAVAFSFAITHDGVDINYDREVLHVVWQSGVRSWKKRFIRFQNNVRNGVYPASLKSLFLVTSVVTALYFAGTDLSFGVIKRLESVVPWERLAPSVAYLVTCILYSFLVWVVIILSLRYSLKLLLMYKGWMYESREAKKRVSPATILWLGLMKLLRGNKPMLYSYQASLPRLPLPSLDDTMQRYLKSVAPLLDEAKYKRMESLAREFRNGIGSKLQRYLWLKSWWSSNYVSDWWEDFVYLRGRTALMVNSNFYGTECILAKPTSVQTARAANMVHAAFIFRRSIERQTLKPIMIQNLVPLCSWQYERIFNTTRVPGIETDKLVHYSDSQHVLVYSRGCYFKVPVYYKGRLLRPCELQVQMEKILKSDCTPLPGEERLGALTAADRVTWCNTRKMYFSKGPNRFSLEAIEKAAFFVSLDEEPYEFDREDSSKLNHYGRCMLHGKGYDRWFDKSFSFLVGNNGMIGFNSEHSWADAPIMGHLWEFCLAYDCVELGYTEDGNTKGVAQIEPPAPIRLKWDIVPECIDVIERCVLSAQSILEDVDLRLTMFDTYGKGFMKQCKVSPDAFVQMTLQLAYYMDAGKFSLTYEASMTRLFREGRTETVRPVTSESCQWVKAMQDGECPNEEKRRLLQRACQVHQEGYQDTMCGKGIDRHLFCLYVVSKYLEVDSPFLGEVLGEPWRLSTSQTPHRQTDLLPLKHYPKHLCGGGGFGPVADDGYGVSYMIAGEDVIFFHVSSKKSSPETDSSRFTNHLRSALRDIQVLFRA